MSSILPSYTEKQIKLIVIQFLEDLFGFKKEPKEVRISEFVIIVVYGTSKNEGMTPHKIQGLFYAENEQGEIAIVNITNPSILSKYANNNSPLLVESS